MSIASPTPDPTRHRGEVREWNAEKGYGFVQHGRQRLFVHIRDFAERHRTPSTGDELTYTIGADLKGRPCAKDVLQPNDGGRIRPAHLLVLGALLASPVLAVWRLAPREFAAALAVVAFLSSVVSYGLYFWDKRRARKGVWRISEKTLHLWELLGGWPGAFLAQRQLRHKSSKASYQVAFWLIVLTHNTLALDWQLDWRITRSVRDRLGKLAEIVPGSPAPKSTVY